MLDDIAKFAGGLHKTTGIPLKMIAQSAVQITNDTERMGDVTAEEATRISATLGQLGQTYDSFTGVLDKFQEFGSSAETSGLISQITGGAVNLDAKHLMYLASEEQEKFLPELRRSLLGGGFTKESFESLGKSEQRQMAGALSMQREELRSLLDTSRAFNESDLIDAQAKITADKTTTGMQVITDQMELAPKYADDTKKSIDYMRAQALQPLQQDLLNAADEYARLNSNIRDNIKYTDAAAVTEGMRGAVQTQGAIAKKAASKLDKKRKIGSKELGEVLSEGAERVAEKQNPKKVIPPKKPARAPSPTPKPAAKNVVVKPISKKSPPVIKPEPGSDAESIRVWYESHMQQKNENDAAVIEANNKTNADILALLTAASDKPPEPKELVLKVDKDVLGRIMLNNTYIQGGKPYSLLKTESE